jgi:hypothetical protein
VRSIPGRPFVDLRRYIRNAHRACPCAGRIGVGSVPKRARTRGIGLESKVDLIGEAGAYISDNRARSAGDVRAEIVVGCCRIGSGSCGGRIAKPCVKMWMEKTCLLGRRSCCRRKFVSVTEYHQSLELNYLCSSLSNIVTASFAAECHALPALMSSSSVSNDCTKKRPRFKSCR